MYISKDDKAKRQIAISIAQFFEDHLSETHLFDLFLKRYKEMFHENIPFAKSGKENEEATFEQKLEFVVWHAFSAMNNKEILPPHSPILKEITDSILQRLKEPFENNELPRNTELKHFMYDKNSFTNIMTVKTILIWLESNCFLGFWTHNQDYKFTKKELQKYGKGHTSDTLNYVIHSQGALNNMAWPLSIPAKSIYADLVRMEQNDASSEMAKKIESINQKAYKLYRILSISKKNLTLEDTMHHKFKVSLDTINGLTSQNCKKSPYIYGAFIQYNGSWALNGFCNLCNTSQENWEKLCLKDEQTEQILQNSQRQNEKYIREHGNKRLYFFPNEKIAKDWEIREVGKTLIETQKNCEIKDNEPVMLYFEHKGLISTIINPYSVNSRENIFYDAKLARMRAHYFLLHREACSADFLHYLLENNLLTDTKFAFSDLEFLARCFRRDIDSSFGFV